jgi:glycosyltransferase involved in cell wall biosynthesis
MSSISVIIPAYNAEKYIGEAIESALAQTRPAQEILVVDDASADRTVEIARSYGKRIKVIVNELNSGPGHSRNAGVAASTGDYLAFLDADDKWLPGHLAGLAGMLDQWPDAGFACSGLRQFGVREGRSLQYPECQQKPTNIFALIMRRDALYPSTALVRRAAFDKIEGFDEIVRRRHGRRIQVEDYDFFLRLSVDALCVSTPLCTALYRVHEAQASVLGDEQMHLAFRYRMRQLSKMRGSGKDALMLGIGIDQMRHAWDARLREAWLGKSLPKLRAMILWGMWRPMLFPSCCHYVPRAFLPYSVVRIGKRLLGKK